MSKAEESSLFALCRPVEIAAQILDIENKNGHSWKVDRKPD